jgi:peptidyl-prolyl cis-trans isomerase SurA
VSSRQFLRAVSFLQIFGCAVALSACTSSGAGWFGSDSAAAATATPPAPQTATTPLAKTVAHSSIPALVNDVPITEYDVNQRMRLDRLGNGGKPANRAAVVDELIDELVEAIEGQRQQINIPDQQVDGAFANIAQHVKMSPAALVKALASEGIDAKSLKKRLRAQMLWQALVQRRTVAKAQVTNQAVKEALAAKGNAASQTITEYRLQQIIFVVPRGSAAAVAAQRRNQAVAFRQRFAGCESSIEQAKQLRDVVVKDMGRRMASDLTGPQGEAVLKTKVGETTLPLATDDGIALIAVCATHDVQSTAQVRTEVENNLYIKQAADLGKDYLKELRDRAIIERR